MLVTCTQSQNDTLQQATVHYKLECGPMPNVMVALLNIGETLCSTPQSLARAHCSSAAQYHCQDAKPVEICRGAPNSPTDLSGWQAEVHHIVGTCGGDIAV